MNNLNNMVDEIFEQERLATARDNQNFKMPLKVKRKTHRNKYDKTAESIAKDLNCWFNVMKTVKRAVIAH